MPGSTGSSPVSTVSADSAGAPVAELREARKSFGSVEALKGITLEVRTGELLAVLGPNGAGKTTAISLLLGLRRPTSGTARLFGRDPQDLHARSQTGVMLQESGIPLTLKVKEVIDLFRSYYPKPLATDQVIEAAAVGDFQDRLNRNLSGGQRQRVYFALAICGDPELLFLDEPTVGLDVGSRRAFWEQLRLFKKRGKSLVMTTHYIEEADALADRVVVIDQGVIVADDAPEIIRSRVPGKKVSFRLAGVSAQTFAGLPVERLEIEDERVSFLTSDPEGVLRNLLAKDVKLADLEVVGAGLEEAVLALTGGR
jgi:ABC-2 type transport system ATP-binding protein